jgi:platelet-activating factor acetylhydrolase
MRAPTGPYPVGVHDARLADRAGGHRVRLFYPAAAANSGRGPARWLPRSHAKGFADETMLGVMRFIKAPFPSVLGTLTSYVASTKLYATLDGNMAESETKFPLVLFSHGLGGSISFYSIACIDMASHGHVVAALEHTDGSAVAAFVGEERKEVPYRCYRGLDADGSEWELRNTQLRTRLDDMDALLAALRVANSPGGQPLVPLEDSRTSRGPDLQGRIDFENLSLCGHSFGGGTVLAYGMRHPLIPKRIVCIDPWLFSLKQEDLSQSNAGLREGCPLLFVDMELSQMETSIAARKTMNAKYDTVSVVGACHNNASDFPVVVPMFIATLAEMTRVGSDPAAILASQSEVCCAFLTGRWPALKAEISEAHVVRGLASAMSG